MKNIEVLKCSKLDNYHSNDFFSELFARATKSVVKTLTGIPPLTFRSNGTPLIDYLITGNTVQSGTPTPDNPIIPQGCGELEAGQYKIPISSANTTTPVYLGEVQATRRVKKLVLTGEEAFEYDSRYVRFSFTISDIMQKSSVRTNELVCSHYIAIYDSRPISNIPNNSIYCGTGRDVYIKTDLYTTADDFKAYLAAQYAAGTPVCVWYVLATEETGIVNEPLMKIGDYADTVSKAQAGVDVPTNNGSTTVDVDTTVKPSEVYIKYMG